MHELDYNRPNFVAFGLSNGFVSYCRPEYRRCTAFWIVMTTAQLVAAGKDSELLEMNGGLPSDFGEGGRSSGFLTTEVLGEISWKLGTYDVPYRMSLTQAYELAQLAVALLNYDVNHADDDTPILCTAYERQIVIGMITLVHDVANQSALLNNLLEADEHKLAVKSRDKYACSTRP